MQKRLTRVRATTVLSAAVLLAASITPAMSHHSFAMFDQTRTITMTGVVTRFVPQANHAELLFVVVGEDGRPARESDGQYVTWGAELSGAAAMARQGVTADSFAAGTVFSIKLNPLRDGGHFGNSVGTIVKCPEGKVPEPGRHCDSVEGSTFHGGDAF